ncbi:hypothetical protein EYF80_028058 [Liparis tanakae]|uniref:Uncharacterized protein n=1 Tax=Liparis tanakae TaxID=230148 RepID=A0A4Z2H7F2_9TELE|nr:hypothetical protein EYF80_028058 [Liparis tanakae]
MRDWWTEQTDGAAGSFGNGTVLTGAEQHGKPAVVDHLPLSTKDSKITMHGVSPSAFPWPNKCSNLSQKKSLCGNIIIKPCSHHLVPVLQTPSLLLYAQYTFKSPPPHNNGGKNIGCSCSEAPNIPDAGVILSIQRWRYETDSQLHDPDT